MISFALIYQILRMSKFEMKGLLCTWMFFLCLSACSSGPDKLGRLDLRKWRSDRNGCKNVREGLVGDFKNEQKQLLGKFIDQVGEILGRPDIHQLGERNTKFYVYFLEKGPQCEDITKKSVAKKVILKFNAVGLLSEITYQDRAL
jgi:outer membrane protein assembly factor BamE (lipoprotein component of BamABCDE complex)